MAILEIKEYSEPVLREKALPVEEVTPEILNLIKDMGETMYADSGVGLAAPQVGVSKRIILVDGEEDGLIVLINPMIIQWINSIDKSHDYPKRRRSCRRRGMFKCPRYL
jgi:peptide deformylase